jgi:hypothetical protein
MCEIDFHTEKELYSAKFSKNSPDRTLLNVSTSKTMESPAGSFQITFKGDSWYSLLNSNDLVVIKMGRRPGKLDTVMVGLIDEVRRSRDVGSGGAKSVMTRIVGRDFGKVLIQAIIKWFPQFRKEQFPLEQLGGAGSAIMQMITYYSQTQYQIGEPANLLDNAIRNILMTLMNFEVKFYPKNADFTTATLQELLRFRLGGAYNIIPFMTTMSQYEGSLWNYMDSVKTSPFHELFLDTRTDYGTVVPPEKVKLDSWNVGKFSAMFGEDDAKVVLFYRPTPFDKEDWDALYTHTITDVDVLDDDIGKSDRENYNMFLVKPALNVLNQAWDYAGIVLPRFNADNIKRYGISILETSVPGDFGKDTEGKNADAVKMGEKLSDTLKRWFEHNIDYENGTMVVRGKGDYKIGQRVYSKDLKRVFYIEGVAQSFNMLENWQTTLTVTRGQPIEGLAPIPGGIINGTEEQKTPEQALPQAANTQYTVVDGDTLWGIAMRFYGDGSQLNQILKANPQITVADRINVGDVLIIPNPTRT